MSYHLEEGKTLHKSLKKKDRFEKQHKSAKCSNSQETFADGEGKALSFLLLFALQLTYMPSCINRITTETHRQLQVSSVWIP